MTAAATGGVWTGVWTTAGEPNAGAILARCPADTAESWLAGHYDDLVAWRRHIHRHPELGRQEFATTQFVADRLVEAGLNPKVLPQGTGLTCDFGPDYAPRIALRADMDALPMTERTGAPYASTVPGWRTPAATTPTPRWCWVRRPPWRRHRNFPRASG